jgi:CRISPR-associated protein Cas5d
MKFCLLYCSHENFNSYAFDEQSKVNNKVIAMKNFKRPYRIKVKGEYALFSRPETQAEPFSYPIMPPTAAEGLLEAIFWKPEFDWKILGIEILEPVQYANFTRNHIEKRQRPGKRLFSSEMRVQTHQAVLKNVAYVIECDIELRPHATESIGKYCDQFERRMDSGGCFQQPFLGIREFIAEFSWADERECPWPDTRNCGQMPLKINYLPDPNGQIQWRDRVSREYVRGRAVTEWFEANVENGRLDLSNVTRTV